jgi:hypothetical protein
MHAYSKLTPVAGTIPSYFSSGCWTVARRFVAPAGISSKLEWGSPAVRSSTKEFWAPERGSNRLTTMLMPSCGEYGIPS